MRIYTGTCVAPRSGWSQGLPPSQSLQRHACYVCKYVVYVFACKCVRVYAFYTR